MSLIVQCVLYFSTVRSTLKFALGNTLQIIAGATFAITNLIDRTTSGIFEFLDVNITSDGNTTSPIHKSYSRDGVLSVFGNATIAEYIDVLSTLTYRNTHPFPRYCLSVGFSVYDTLPVYCSCVHEHTIQLDVLCCWYQWHMYYIGRYANHPLTGVILAMTFSALNY